MIILEFSFIVVGMRMLGEEINLLNAEIQIQEYPNLKVYIFCPILCASLVHKILNDTPHHVGGWM